MDNTKFAASAYRYFLIWGICASLATTVCTMVDALLVGNLVGSNGLAVTNISTPVFLVYALLGITMGVGANVHIGRLLGESDVDGANQIFHRLLCLSLIVGAVSLFPLFMKDRYFSFLGVTEELYPLAESYLTVVMWSAPIFILYHVLSVSVRTDSDPKRSAIASAVVILTNLVLDLLFMQVLGWGIVGASASLCIAETIGILVLLTHFGGKRRLLKLGVSLPKSSEIGQFVYNGFGLGSASIFGAVVMLAFNTLLLRFEEGTLYVAVYGIIYTINTIPVAVFDGASGALSTVTAYLAGESDTEGILTVLKKALLAAILGGGFLAAVCAVFSGTLVQFFGLEDAMAVERASAAMRIFTISMVFAGVNMVVTAFWQSIGRGRLAGIMSMIRNCILLLIIGGIFIPKANITGLAISYICTEVLCTVMVVGVFMSGSSKKYISEKYAITEKYFEGNYVIETESMEQISRDLERLCDEWDIGMKQAFFINFICEELLLNIIKFGLEDVSQNKAAQDYYISIKLMQKGEDYILRIRDNVSLYNPFEQEGDEIDSGVLKLIQKKTKYCDYQRKMIFNYLYMII